MRNVFAISMAVASVLVAASTQAGARFINDEFRGERPVPALTDPDTPKRPTLALTDADTPKRPALTDPDTPKRPALALADAESGLQHLALA